LRPRLPARTPRILRALVLALLPALVALPAHADADADRARFLDAHALAEHGPDERWKARAIGLEAYTLFPYLEHAAFKRNLAHADTDKLRAFLDRHAGAPFAEDLRRDYLEVLGAGARHSEFLALYRNDGDVELRCREIAARAALDASDAQLPGRVRELLLAGKRLPASCAVAEQTAQAVGLETPAFRWQRVLAALAAKQLSLALQLAAGLPGPDRDEAGRYASLLGDPVRLLPAALKWQDGERARGVLALALTRLASADTDAAAAAWPAFEAAFAFDEAQRGQVTSAIALAKSASYEDDAALWLARVPEARYEPRLAEWSLRVSLARKAWREAATAVDRLERLAPDEGRTRYWRLRTAQLADPAQPVDYAALAREANYFGFLAAERSGSAYALCPRTVAPDPALRERTLAVPGIARALELREIGWHARAEREWTAALQGQSSEARATAVGEALARGWTQRGPFTLTRPDEQRLYTLRFPIAHEDLIERAANRTGLEPALVFGVIRTESAWVSDAVSRAKARGLMQVLPSTAAQLAKREKLKYAGPASLDRIDLNVALGTRHLADVVGKYGGRTWQALAAYNAGPTPVARWLAARGDLPADVWVETIPYRETREYVERVLAFAAIYGWRHEGRALALPRALAVGDTTATPDPEPYRAVACSIAPESVAARNVP